MSPRAIKAMEKNDSDKDGRVSRSEWTKNPAMFERLDTNSDGFVTLEEFDARFTTASGSRPPATPLQETVKQTDSLPLQTGSVTTETEPVDSAGSARKRSTLTGRLFHQGQAEVIHAMNRMRTVWHSVMSGGIPWQDVVAALTSGKGKDRLVQLLLIAVGLVVAGGAAELFAMRFTRGLRDSLLDQLPKGGFKRAGRLISAVFLDVLGLGVYIAVTFILFSMIFSLGKPGYRMVSIIIIASYNFRLIRLAVRAVLSPSTSNLRLVPMKDEPVIYLYNWIMVITGTAVSIAALSRILTRLPIPQKDLIFTTVYALSGLSIILLLIIMIWHSRKRISKAFSPEHQGVPDAFQTKMADTWHIFATGYILVIGVIWQINLFNGSRGDIIWLILSLLFVPLILAVDQWIQKILKIISGEDTRFIDLTEAGRSHSFIRHYAAVIRKAIRVLLFLFYLFLTLRLWGIDIAVGRYITSHLVGILLALVLGFATWEFAKAHIDKRIREEMPDMEDMEEGGAGGSRIGTLLMLLRKFILAVLVVIISMIMLSGLGIDIGPLIASAGIIGIAIGFGAQKLVQDIISGIFFLIDDAFRVGDYVETGSIKGTVEHISLRSLRLRHPRGMLHTIPYGTMGTLTNYSRDYIITKLEIRVRYDTDVEKVRKIIKKIYKTLKKNEEIAPVLLGKIKSQGVKRMDDSAMIMRVKFKTIPGEQFIVRREVYRLIQEKFRENHIEFAHRNVTVYMPPDSAAKTPAAEKQALAAAAAASQQENSSPSGQVPK